MLGPLNGERRSKVTDSGFCCIVGGLRLGNVNNSTRHATYHDDAAWCLALHEVLGDSGSEQVGPIHIDTPQLLHSIVRIRDGVKVLSKPSRGNKVVNLPVLLNDFCNGIVHRFGVGHIGVVSGDGGQS